MSDPLVLALVAPGVPVDAVAALRAGFEEEGVPLAVEGADGSGHELGRAAATRAVLGLGLGLDAHGAYAVLAAAPGAAYLDSDLGDVRAFAQNAARVVGRRPLRRRPTA